MNQQQQNHPLIRNSLFSRISITCLFLIWMIITKLFKCLSQIRPNKKNTPVFRVSQPYLNLLVKPSFFFRFSGKIYNLMHFAFSKFIKLGDNCIQNFHLGSNTVSYTLGNLVLRSCVSGAVKRDLRPYIRRYTSPNENFEYGYPPF